MGDELTQYPDTRAVGMFSTTGRDNFCHEFNVSGRNAAVLLNAVRNFVPASTNTVTVVALGPDRQVAMQGSGEDIQRCLEVEGKIHVRAIRAKGESCAKVIKARGKVANSALKVQAALIDKNSHAVQGSKLRSKSVKVQQQEEINSVLAQETVDLEVQLAKALADKAARKAAKEEAKAAEAAEEQMTIEEQDALQEAEAEAALLQQRRADLEAQLAAATKDSDTDEDAMRGSD